MLWHHLTFAIRQFLRYKLTTVVKVLSLALGFGCFALSYGMVSYFNSYDQHHPYSKRIYFLAERIVGAVSTATSTRAPEVMADLIKAEFPELLIARAIGARGTQVSIEGTEHALDVAYADPNFLRIFSFPLLSGNSEQSLSQPRSAILTERAALRLFGTANVVGKTFLLGGLEAITVKGIAGSQSVRSHFGDSERAELRFEALISMDAALSLREARPQPASGVVPNAYTYIVFPESGGTDASGFNAVMPAFAKRHPVDSLQREYTARPISQLKLTALEARFNTEQLGFRATSLLLLAAGAVLLVSCLNYINLAIAAGLARGRENGVRRVLGAGRWDLAAQYFIETSLIGFMAMAVGVLLAVLVSPVLSGERPWSIDLDFSALDSVFWLVLAAVLMAVSLAAGAILAVLAKGMMPAEVMRKPSGDSRAWFPKALSIGQYTVVMLLMISVFVVGQQNREMEASAARAAAAPVVMIRNDLRRANVSFDVLRTELLRNPVIEAVTGIRFLPWSGTYGIVAFSPASNSSTPRVPAVLNAVSDDFFSTFSFSLLAGRTFDRQLNDSAAVPDGTPIPVVIDRSSVTRFGWPDPDGATGQILYRPSPDDNSKMIPGWRVIGVVDDRPLQTTGSGATSSVYRLAPDVATSPLIRISAVATKEALDHIAAVWQALAPNTTLGTRFLDEQFELAFRDYRSIGNALMSIAAIAFGIAIAGLLATVAHIVRFREREIGIRKTLGASTRQILAQLLGEISLPLVIAGLLAAPIAYITTSGYLNMFVSRVDLTLFPFIGTVSGVVLITWLAAGAQILRAARLNPATVLRYE